MLLLRCEVKVPLFTGESFFGVLPFSAIFEKKSKSSEFLRNIIFRKYLNIDEIFSEILWIFLKFREKNSESSKISDKLGLWVWHFLNRANGIWLAPTDNFKQVFSEISHNFSRFPKNFIEIQIFPNNYIA